MSIDAQSALAFLMTRPSRPRHQYRTMDDTYIAEDAECARLDTESQKRTSDRLGGLAGRIAVCTAGSVQIMRGPVALASLLVLAIGATTLMR